MVAFMLMEQSDVTIHIIHSLADDRIPFCEYFIIPYVMWYFFLIGTVIYFAISCPSKKEYYQYLGTLGAGMTLFLLISFVYPNGQHLRPDLTTAGDSVFLNVVRLLYKIDTPTNISRACMYSMRRQAVLRCIRTRDAERIGFLLWHRSFSEYRSFCQLCF